MEIKGWKPAVGSMNSRASEREECERWDVEEGGEFGVVGGDEPGENNLRL